MAKEKKEKSLEASLWDTCNKLRGSVEPSEYKHVMLSLIFLKYANDKFDLQRQKMIDEGYSKYLEIVSFYTKDNIFFIPEVARWKYLMSQAKQEDLPIKIDTALHEVEKANSSTLAGALPDNYYSRLGIDSRTLGSLLDKLNEIDLNKEPDKDIFGRVYEYFLSHFALQEGKGKGEYFTPKTVVSLLCELIEPYKGKVYDGASGSGGMFVQSAKFIEEHKGNKKNISVYGQEYTATTLKLSKMNLAIRGISSNFGQAVSTLTNDQHPDLKVDFSLMNPPFNQKEWRNSGEHEDDPRWKGYTVPPVSNANYAWILNMISKLGQDGTGALILANGALSADGAEYEIRRQILKNDLVEAILILPQNMFYTTNISVSVWIFNKNKKARTTIMGRKLRDRTGEVLFMDLRQKGHPYEKKYIEFTPEDRKEITDIFHNWQSPEWKDNYLNIKDLCESVKIENKDLTEEDKNNNVRTIESMDYSLVVSKYIEFNKQTSNADYDSEMKKLQNELSILFKEEEESKKELLNVLEEMGYGIKL
jgi:type I restriction enzyme M protein